MWKGKEVWWMRGSLGREQPCKTFWIFTIRLSFTVYRSKMIPSEIKLNNFLKFETNPRDHHNQARRDVSLHHMISNLSVQMYYGHQTAKVVWNQCYISGDIPIWSLISTPFVRVLHDGIIVCSIAIFVRDVRNSEFGQLNAFQIGILLFIFR